MGGYGAGRTGSRPIAEECLALRVRDLRSLIRGVKALPHAPEARTSRAWTAALTETRSLRLLHKAHQLALSRLTRGVPLFRERASRAGVTK